MKTTTFTFTVQHVDTYALHTHTVTVEASPAALPMAAREVINLECGLGGFGRKAEIVSWEEHHA
jgi:hypothetical protein